MKRLLCWTLVWLVVCTFAGCSKQDDQARAQAQMQKNLSQSFQTTARVKYKGLETQMVIYKKPMNCATVTFESPDSLKDMKLTFFNDRVTIQYEDLSFDFVPDSMPGKAASKLVLSALNTALNDEGVSFEQKDGKLLINGSMEQGDFSLVVDAQSGNILKLSIPDSELEMEVLNFKILE